MTEARSIHLQCPVLVLRVCDAHLSGDVLAEALLDDLLERHRETGAVNVVLEMGAVTYLSSAGISPLLALGKAVREEEGRLVLAGLTPAVLGVLVASRLVATSRGTPAPFESQPDVPAAVASLYGKGSASTGSELHK